MIEMFNNGGPIMVPLLICSFVALTVILERMFFWIEVRRHSNFQIIEEVLELCRQNKWHHAESITSGSRDYIIRVMNFGLKHRNTALSKAMESKATEEVGKMKRRMGVLDTIITATPLLGIFGTVLGIIVSFDLLGAGIKDPSAITGGIAQALITTASGLGIAILTLFPYNYLLAKTDQAIQRIEKVATLLELIHENGLKQHANPLPGFAHNLINQKITNETCN